MPIYQLTLKYLRNAYGTVFAYYINMTYKNKENEKGRY